MIDENKISAVLSKMIRETKENKIKWKVAIGTYHLKLNSSEELVGKIYETEFNGRDIWLFKINLRVQTDEYEYTWIPSYKLVILDDESNIDWEFPDHRAIMDLYDSVSYKVADMDSFFGSIKTDDFEF